MANEKPDQAATPPDNAATVPPAPQLAKAGTVAVTYSAVPPKGPPDKHIHARRPLPEVASAPPAGPDKK